MENELAIKIYLKGSEEFKGSVKSALGKLNSEAISSSKVMSSVKGSISKAFSVIKTSAIAAGAAVVSSFVGIVKNGIKVASELETARQGFVTLLGSAKKADRIIAMIKKDAAKTPFEINGLVQANQLLTSVTKDGKRSEKMLMNVGKALAAMGKGQPELDRIIVNLQQIGAVGKASMIDIKQFAFAGIPIFKMLKKETGLTGDAFQDFIAKGGVTFELLEKMFKKAGTGSGEFAKAFENASGTFNQRLSNLKDNWNMFTADFVTQTGLFDLGKRVIEGLTGKMGEMSPVIKVVRDWIQKLLNPTEEQKRSFERLKTGVMGVVDAIIGKNGMISSVKGMFKEMGAGDTSEIEGALGDVKMLVRGLTTYLDLQIAKWRILADVITTVAAAFGNVDAIAAKSVGMTSEQKAQAKKSSKAAKDLYTNKGAKILPSPNSSTLKPKQSIKVNKPSWATNAPLSSSTLKPTAKVLKSPLDIFRGFASGGVVGGSSTSGDRVMARVNSGEMILTRGQQGALFNMIKNMSSGTQNFNFNAPMFGGGGRNQMQQENQFISLLQGIAS